MISATDLLYVMMERAELKFPGIIYKQPTPEGFTSRAEAAAALVEEGKVEFVGVMPSGSDHWLVNGHRCSIKLHSCDCYDKHAPTHNGGKLCKHRLAAMFQKRIDDEKASIWEAIFNEADDAISLRFDVIYKSIGRDYYLTAYRNGEKWIKIGEKPIDRIAITSKDFDALLKRHGWELASRPSKQAGFGYVYQLRPIEHGAANPQRTLNAAAHETIERKQFNQFAARMMEAA